MLCLEKCPFNEKFDLLGWLNIKNYKIITPYLHQGQTQNPDKTREGISNKGKNNFID